MNRKQRLKKCYFNQPLDRPAVYSRTNYPENDPTYDQLKAYLAANSELKDDFSNVTPAPYPTDSHTEKYSEDFQRHVTVLHTPAGDLTSSNLVGLNGQPPMHDEYLLKTIEDAEKYLSLPIPQITGDPSSFFDTQAKMGNAGIVDVSLGFNPAGFIVELFGSENFAIFSAIERDTIHQLCQRQMTITINLLKYLLDNNIGPFFHMLGEEYIVPPLHGPKDFYEFNVKYDKPSIDLIHNAGGRIHIHSHGSIKNVFQGFIDLGADVLHPFEAPPMGDITAKQAKDLARDKMCLEGNIQINLMYESTPDHIIAEPYWLTTACLYDNKSLIGSSIASPYFSSQKHICISQDYAMIDTVLICY